MKRYLVFASEEYYPAGGWGDFVAAFDDIRAAVSEAESDRHRHKSAHVVDLETLQEVTDDEYNGAKT